MTFYRHCCNATSAGKEERCVHPFFYFAFHLEIRNPLDAKQFLSIAARASFLDSVGDPSS